MANVLLWIYNNYGFIFNIVCNIMIPVLYTKLIVNTHILLQSQFTQGLSGSILFNTILNFIFYYAIMQSMHVFANLFLSQSLPQYIKHAKNKLVNYICKLDFVQVSQNNPLVIQTMIERYVSALTKMLEQIWVVWMPIITDLVITIFNITIKSNKIMLLILLAWIIGIIILISVVTFIYYRLSRKINEAEANENAFLTEQMNNLLLTKVLNMEGYLLSNYSALSDKTESSFKKSLIILGNNKFVVGSINVAFCLLSIYISSKLIDDAGIKASFFAIFWNMTRLIWNMATNVVLLLNSYSQYQQSKDVFTNITPLEFTATNTISDISTISAINYDLYQDNKLILANINLQIQNNGLVLFQGRSGIGKTSLLLTLCGIYHNNNSDNLLINGYSVNKYNPNDLIKQFAISLQQDYIYNISLQENIILSNKYDDKILKKVLNETGFIEIINTRNWNIATLLCGLNGSILSGGERKLVSLCRLLYHIYINADKKYVIILDEPLNHLDTYIINEYIIKLLQNLASKYLVLCTSHNQIISDISNQNIILA